MKTTQLQIRISPDQKKLVKKLSAAANLDLSAWVLKKILPNPSEKIHELLKRLSSTERKDEQSFILNELNVFLAGLSKEDFSSCISVCPWDGLDEFLENYLSAMIEYTCAKHRIKPPSWLATGLAEPFFSSTLPSLRLYLLVSSPPSFRKRNIFIDSTIGDAV